jgi:threonine synthase
MFYQSTRGQTPAMPFKDAVITGLAPDGGLLVPGQIPDVREHLAAWAELDFVGLAKAIIGQFATDIPQQDLDPLIERAYRSFDHPEVVDLVDLGDLKVLELFHGPTLAFKDVALQLLGQLFEYILAERGERLNIIGATSGDTGSARSGQRRHFHYVPQRPGQPAAGTADDIGARQERALSAR